MKIGILTYHCVPNFGAQLQATSTVGFLKRMGHEPVVLNWYPQDLDNMYSIRIPQEQILCHKDYTEEILPITKICRSEKELVETIDSIGLDAIIVGSDALFKYIPYNNRKIFSKRYLRYIEKKVLSVERLEGNPFFGGFVTKLTRHIPVGAFSVSSQNCNYSDMGIQEKADMKNCMSNFCTISVRDEWTKDMVENILGVSSIKVTPDPVFSFNQNCYVNIPSKTEILKRYGLTENYVLISFSTWYSSSEYIKSLAIEVERRGLLPVAFPMPEKLFAADVDKRIRLPLTPLDWYALIKYSRGYIGERMHPIVVCIHNSVPFYCFDEYGIYRSSWGGLRKKYVRDSSKTYHILYKAGLTEWMHSYKMCDSLPKPMDVVNKLLNFNTSKCQEFSVMYQKQYEYAMLNLVQKLV